MIDVLNTCKALTPSDTLRDGQNKLTPISPFGVVELRPEQVWCSNVPRPFPHMDDALHPCCSKGLATPTLQGETSAPESYKVSL